MWNIVSVSTASGSGSYIILGGAHGKEVVGPTGPFCYSYVIAFPGLGYIKLTDEGNGVVGPGDWSVAVSGSSTNWFYEGTGSASVAVDASGKYTISGGSNSISGQM
ncbi:hypothetical protein FIBSPDRAFT_904518 [Athelia psychrophila]|uniref:Uncharacterized protein n=1 Tax=Athelia psychrophila TaxID=1759441 RepID=A0A167UMS2_9AGAM|nr:hypothetical protein FIBSPDRAFT_904518 [Fibularhizoctonia sp. CBS 109695]